MQHGSGKPGIVAVELGLACAVVIHHEEGLGIDLAAIVVIPACVNDATVLEVLLVEEAALGLDEIGTGTVFGERFELHEDLGVGRAGTLYKALDRELGDWVAVPGANTALALGFVSSLGVLVITRELTADDWHALRRIVRRD